MDAYRFKEARRHLKLTEVSFGEAFGVSRRTVQNWAKKGPPPYIAQLLELLLLHQIAGPVEQTTDVSDLVERLDPALDRTVTAAVSAGWSRDQSIKAIATWAASKLGVNHN